MKTIIGITIGPIVETISESKKISEIANASLFFSTIIEKFLIKINEKKGYRIITPSFNGEIKEEKFYPDRVILEALDKKEKKVVLNEIEDIYFEIISSEQELLDLKEYLNFNIVVESFEKEEDIKNIFEYLNGVEVIKNFSVISDSESILKNISNYLDKKKTLNRYSYAVDYGSEFSNSEGGYRAVIALDLDKMTSFSQKTLEDIYEISKSIYEYINELNKFFESKKNKDRKKEGIVLYSAGDDILAILNPKYIFEFIEYASETLNKVFKKFNNRELSVSFGIFVCYAKYPIKEAIDKANSLLFGNAKNTRNTASILFQKHSGQSFGFNFYNLIDKSGKENKFNKENPFFKYLKENINIVENDKTQDRLLNTIIQKVSMNEFVLRYIITKKDRINNYMEELFDEKEIGKNQLGILKELLYYVGTLDNRVIEEDDKFQQNLFQVLSFFRILKFYMSKGKGETVR